MSHGKEKPGKGKQSARNYCQTNRIFGNEPKGENEILLGSTIADTLHLSPGDAFSLGGESLKVAGVLEQTVSQDDSLVFAPLKKAQKLLGKVDKITLVEVAVLCAG